MNTNEVLKLALEALELAQDNLRDHGENCFLHDEGEYNRCFCGKDSLSNHLQSVVEKLEEALAEPQEKYQYGTPLLDAMRGKANEALDKKAENARELGLDYEPAQQEPDSFDDDIEVIGHNEIRTRWRLEKGTKLYTSPQPAQQEPVVFYRCNGCGHAYEQMHPTSCDCMEAGGFDRVEYYTSPPAQRTWVGLTEGEMLDALTLAEKETVMLPLMLGIFAKTLEAKLREKNT